MRQNGIVELRISEPVKKLEVKILRHRRHFWKKLVMTIIVIAMAVSGTFWLVKLQTYNRVNVIDNYGHESTENTKYSEFADGFLKYGRDGVSLLNRVGGEQWNQPYQVKSPLVEICDKTAIIGDKGGTQILVFDKNGLKGEIKTTLPIEKLSVSSQGVVAALLKDEVSPKVVCYDATGNILVEHEVSLKKSGYPLDVSLSPNGYLLLVTYLQIQDNNYTTRVAYYNFDKVGQDETDNQVSLAEFKGTIMPTAFYMKDSVSAIVGEDALLIYKGKQIPKLTKEIKLDKEIKSVVHTDGHIGLLLKNAGKGGYELRVYNSHGMQTMSKKLKGEYSNIQMSGNEIIMYEGPRCNIYSINGVNKFKGELEFSIGNIIPVLGMNKYMVMNANGLQEIRLAK